MRELYLMGPPGSLRRQMSYIAMFGGLFWCWRSLIDPIEIHLSRMGENGSENRNIIPLSTQWWWNQYRSNSRPQRVLDMEEAMREFAYVRQRCRQLGWKLPRTEERNSWFQRTSTVSTEPHGTALVPCAGDRAETVVTLARTAKSGGGGFATVIAVDFLDRALRRLGPAIEACAQGIAPTPTSNRVGNREVRVGALDHPDSAAAILTRVKGLCADLFVVPARPDLISPASVDFIFDRAALCVQDPLRRGDYLDALSTLAKSGAVAYFNGVFRNEASSSPSDAHWGSQTETVVSRGRGNIPVSLLAGPPFHTHPRDLEASLKLRGWEVDVDIGPLLQQIRNFTASGPSYAEYRLIARYAPSEFQREKAVHAAVAGAKAAEANVVAALSLAAALDKDAFAKEAAARDTWMRKMSRLFDSVKEEVVGVVEYVGRGFTVDEEKVRKLVTGRNQESGLGSGAFVPIHPRAESSGKEAPV